MTEPNLTTQQRLALSALIVTNEKMVASGELEIELSVSLRFVLSHVLNAFQMPAVYERANDNETPDEEWERDLSVIRGLLNPSSIWEQDYV